jgi:signal transduction histidine kinase
MVRRTLASVLDIVVARDRFEWRRVHSIWKVLIPILCILPLAATGANSSPAIAYRTVDSILSLPYDVAVKGGRAELKGTITLSSPKGLVLHDHTAGIWVDCRDGFKGNFAVGDVVTVIGTVGPGAYSPEIDYPTIQLNGHAPLPPSRKVSFEELSSGQQDAQSVAIEGLIRSVNLRNDALTTVPDASVFVTVDMTEGSVDVVLPTQYYERLIGLIGAKARITATALARKNDDRQSTGVLLVVPDINDVTVLQPGPPDLFSTRMVPIGYLLQYGSHTDYFHRVRLRGTLTYYRQGHRFILQDGSRAIEVTPASSESLQVGDRIEAVGFPSSEAAGPVIHDAVIRRLGKGAPPDPIPITLQQALASRYRSCLVSFHSRLVRVISEPARTLLLVDSGHNLTVAELEANVALPAWLRPGSDLRLTGIDMLTVEGGIDYLNYNETSPHSVLLLRSLDDISLISPATPWTQRRLLYVIGVLGILLTAFLVLLFYTQITRWKAESTFRERERLASDVHDTLAQSFTGVGLQLQVIRRAITTGDPNLLHHVDTARDLVRFSHNEARKFLMPRGSPESLGEDLLSSLSESAQALVKNGQIQVEAHHTGHVRTIPRQARVQLFRIGQEAIANAIRHADTTRLVISIQYEDRLVRLKIVDDGRGFVMRGDLLGFGIRGMRKRASEINADFDLVSVPGAGTTITVSVPIPKRGSVSSFFHFADPFWKLIGEYSHHGSRQNPSSTHSDC